jgi:hypothetical protein
MSLTNVTSMIAFIGVCFCMPAASVDGADVFAEHKYDITGGFM